ncbi:hypothetical protein D3C76_1430850 [compost metagenome]
MRAALGSSTDWVILTPFFSCSSLNVAPLSQVGAWSSYTTTDRSSGWRVFAVVLASKCRTGRFRSLRVTVAVEKSSRLTSRVSMFPLKYTLE